MSNNKETSYTVEKSRILEAAEECQTTSNIMHILFPEAFEESKRLVECGDCYDWILAGTTYIVIRVNMHQYTLASLSGTWYSGEVLHNEQCCYDSLEELSDHIYDLQNAEHIVYVGKFKDLYLRTI